MREAAFASDCHIPDPDSPVEWCWRRNTPIDGQGDLTDEFLVLEGPGAYLVAL
jgi:hypothetical protein